MGFSVGGVSFSTRAPVASASTSTNLTRLQRKALEVERQELSSLGRVLADLRSDLKQLQAVGLDVASEDQAAFATSASSLNLSSADTTAVINTVSNLSGISSGNFSINGVSISVDVTADSLADVIARINASAADSTASISTNSDSVTVHSDSTATTLTLADGTSNFFTGINITPGTSNPTAGDESLGEAPKIQRLLQKIGESMDKVFDPDFQALSSTLLGSIQDDLKKAVDTGFKLILSSTTDLQAFRSGLGLDFNFTDPTQGVFEYRVDKFRRSFETNPSDLKKLLFLEPGGLVPGMIKALDQLGKTPLSSLDPQLDSGFLVALRV